MKIWSSRALLSDRFSILRKYYWLTLCKNILLLLFRRNNALQQGTPSLKSEKLTTTLAKKTTANPVFATPSASVMGGIPSGIPKTKLTSPKVYPAPQPPLQWPISIDSNRVKKLNWGDDKVNHLRINFYVFEMCIIF